MEFDEPENGGGEEVKEFDGEEVKADEIPAKPTVPVRHCCDQLTAFYKARNVQGFFLFIEYNRLFDTSSVNSLFHNRRLPERARILLKEGN